MKFVQAATLAAVGLGTLGLLKHRWNEAAVDLLHRLALGHRKRLATALAEHALTVLHAASPHGILTVALGTFLYAGVFLVEGVGLWRCKRWAEYLTVFVTASLLPFEMLAPERRLTLPRAAAFALNGLVLGYLLWRLWVGRQAHSADSGLTKRPAARYR